MNKDQSKSLLSSIQKITKLTRGQELTTDLITDITDAATLLAEFYEISVFQAIILSLFLSSSM